MLAKVFGHFNDFNYLFKNQKDLVRAIRSMEKYQLVQNEKKVELRINQIAKSMLLDPNYLKKTFTSDSTTFTKELLNLWKEESSIYNEARHHFHTIISKYLVVDDLALFNTAPSEKKIHISVSNLMRIVKKCTLFFSKNSHLKETGINLLDKELNYHLLTKIDNNGLVIIRWSGKRRSPNEHLGSGSFCTVQKIYNLSEGIVCALKIALPASRDLDSGDAENSLKNEIEKRNYIHYSKLRPGIQPPALALFIIKKSIKLPFCASVEKFYNQRDLFWTLERLLLDPNTLNPIEGLELGKNLILALRQLHKQRIIHGDIKIENIFVEKNSAGQFELSIGDFGGARYFWELSIDSPSLLNSPYGTICSLGYFTRGDTTSLQESIDNKDKNRWIKYSKKRDTFALNTVIWTLLYGGWPFSGGQDHIYPVMKEGLLRGEDIVRKKYGDSIVDILKLALDENPDKRPGKKKMLEAIDVQIDRIRFEHVNDDLPTLVLRK